MCAEEIVEASKNGQVIPSEKDLKNYLKKWDKKYGTTYKVLEILQNIFYRNDSAEKLLLRCVMTWMYKDLLLIVTYTKELSP